MYKIVCAGDIEKLTNTVNRLQLQGWECQGGVAVAYSPHIVSLIPEHVKNSKEDKARHMLYVMQALVKLSGGG